MGQSGHTEIDGQRQEGPGPGQRQRQGKRRIVAVIVDCGRCATLLGRTSSNQIGNGRSGSHCIDPLTSIIQLQRRIEKKRKIEREREKNKQMNQPYNNNKKIIKRRKMIQKKCENHVSFNALASILHYVSQDLRFLTKKIKNILFRFFFQFYFC